MNCDTCSDKLADFLLDELPESEAVLVHEHLNLCPECMRKYRELKGTGKALEAVPALQVVQASAEFRQAVRTNARSELASIIERLPPEKRLRLEARRAARISQVMEQQAEAPRSAVWNAWMLGGVGVGVLVLATIIFNPFGGPGTSQKQLGQLAMAVGKVEQFFIRDNEPNTPVNVGQAVKRGDAFSTAEGSRAAFRIENQDVFVGPSTNLNFRPGASEDVIVILEYGDLGLRLKGATAAAWEIWLDGSVLLPSADAHLYLHTARGGKEPVEITVLAGSARIRHKSGETVATVDSGHRAVYVPSTHSIKSDPLTTLRVPAWRTTLITDQELMALAGGSAKVRSRTDKSVEVELYYGPQSPAKALGDWVSDPAGSEWPVKGQSLALPVARLRHVVPFAAPLHFELSFNRDSLPDANISFGVLRDADSGVAVDVARDAVVTLREKDKPPRKASVQARAKKGSQERLRLEVARESNFFAVQLQSSSAKGSAMPLPREAGVPSGELWLQGFSDGILLDEIKITAILPTPWLQERLVR